MGNASSAGSVAEHVEQARKTGVCSLKDRRLTKVRSSRAGLFAWVDDHADQLGKSNVTVTCGDVPTGSRGGGDVEDHSANS